MRRLGDVPQARARRQFRGRLQPPPRQRPSCAGVCPARLWG